ncbi:hypothetical protein FJ651_06855 [Paucihalobacter ruber]|uniref:Uncharacterized protein n=1 Tax=Paucihalobacter ruber TaxID=2567861 RepID=A0A506PJ77_9FLAO|nr:hypothetical protein [Paucihalobacter ruber]TPV33873.1 hypothetical protein FJ651_06855 [Paucihalobacter ruber]
MKTPLLYLAILVSLLLVGNTQMMAQQKYEREVRISADDVHPDALKFLKDSPVNSKVKWYREIGLDTTSIEAKTKYKGQRYSIEFSENGVLEDVEVEIKARDLKPDILKNIEQTIEQAYGDFKIEKIQLQYTGSPQLLKSVFGSSTIPDAVIIKYELVISSKESETFKRFELLFNEELELERTTEIITKNDINIEY